MKLVSYPSSPLALPSIKDCPSNVSLGLFITPPSSISTNPSSLGSQTSPLYSYGVYFPPNCSSVSCLSPSYFTSYAVSSFSVQASSYASTNSDFSTSFSLAENVTTRNDSSLSSFFSKSFKLISFMPTAALLPQALKTNRNDNNIKLTNPIFLIFSHQLHFVHFFQYNNKGLR